jgi:hypothetical protein
MTAVTDDDSNVTPDSQHGPQDRTTGARIDRLSHAILKFPKKRPIKDAASSSTKIRLCVTPAAR